MMQRFTDQPGRVLAVFLFGPTIVYKGFKYNKDAFLIIFGILLILWDAYWLAFKEPKEQRAMVGKSHTT